mmetsp:Transcript_29324/g.44745  ORF Transcript_29324/g.44745 Transcript_29324/m.44745 type:complete len:239 (+) Transcript_29324:2-718(+)
MIHKTVNFHELIIFFIIVLRLAPSGSAFSQPSRHYFVCHSHLKPELNLDLFEGEAQSIDSGALIWDAGSALAEYLTDNASEVSGKRILELGSGTGVVGLTAASLGATEVILTDKPELMTLLEQNIEANGLASNARAMPLVWGDDVTTALLHAGDDNLLRPDIVCGSDLLYAPDSFEFLLDTVLQVCQHVHTQVWLAYPTRFTEEIFFNQAIEYFDELEPPREIDSGIFLSRLQRRVYN